MSTASHLPLQPLPPSTISEEEAQALKQQVAHRLAEHRQRRPKASDAQSALPLQTSAVPQQVPAQRRNRVADQVAAKFAGSVSYRDFLQQEAEAAIRKAEAAAEVARRNAEAIFAAQHQLLEEIDHWNAHDAVVATEVAAGVLPIASPEEMEETWALTAPGTPAVAEAEAAPVEMEPVAPVVVAAAVPQKVPLILPAEPLEPPVALPTNLIEFPRQLVAARKVRPRLAEGPLREEADESPERAQLRIFEVEASALSLEPVVESVLPEWHSIRLDAAVETHAAGSTYAQISFALPLHVAPASQRLMAALVDGCCVMTGFLLAVVTAVYVSPVMPAGLPAAISAAGTLLLFSLGYYTLCFSLGDQTPGMRYARVGLCTFGDENPSRKSMRRRLLALMLAGMPLGLGFVWALLDEEGLGWHDRISRMYPRAY